MALNGANREKEDAKEAESDALEQVAYWKNKAEQQREAKNKWKKKCASLNDKVVGKVVRAFERLRFGQVTDGGEEVKEKVSELISKDTADPDWSSEGDTF